MNLGQTSCLLLLVEPSGQFPSFPATPSRNMSPRCTIANTIATIFLGQRAAWAGALEQRSFQATFRYAWESRLQLSVARPAYVHAQAALAKLVPSIKAPKEGRLRKGQDPLLNAGVFHLRPTPPSPWGGGGGF